jgi:hypothetical protein
MTKGVSNEIRQTAGTTVTDPNHRGMNGDIDAGGGYRTTEKVAGILDEIGVKDSTGARVKVKNGVLETNGNFGMTVNADPGLDRVGSSGHQAQVKQGAAHAETYVSETGGAVQSQTLKDHLATLDHTKKAHGMNEPPGKLVGSPEGQGMVKGALKAANQAGLSPETIEAIARQNGIKDPANLIDRMAEIKAGKATIVNAEEAAKLQGVSRDILQAAEATTKAKAEVEIKNTKMKVLELEAQGKTAEAQRLRNEVADYNAKADASNKALAAAEHGSPQGGKETQPKSQAPGTEPSAAQKPKATTASEPAVAAKGPGSQPKAIDGPEPAAATGGKLMKGAGWALGAYGIYEGYKTACEEMAAKKQDEPKGLTGWTANKAELAGRTIWHGLGFGAAADIGKQAGKDSFEQYKKDIADGKVSADSWGSYGWMKARGVLGALYGGVKAITYDAAKNTGTLVGQALNEGVGATKDNYDVFKNARGENQTRAEQSKKIHDTLIQRGASTVGAKLAADGVLNGDFSEAQRLNKVLQGKQAAKLAATQKIPEKELAKLPADPLKAKPEVAKPEVAKTLPGKEVVKGKGEGKDKDGVKSDPAKLPPAVPTKEEEARVNALIDAEIIQLRDAIAKTRAAMAQLRAIGGAPMGEVSAALASMTARYNELTAIAAKAKAKGLVEKQPAATPPPEKETQGGTVTAADGSRTVLTYRTDASGKKVPVTTEYDRNGRLLRQTTVDNKGQTVPLRK